jgi:hypothetical protein
MNILKIIEEEALNYAKSIYRNTEPSELPNYLVVEHIIDYLYDNNGYNIVKGTIKTYEESDGIKSIFIEIIGNEKGPYKGNIFYTYPHISFNLISNQSGFNIETVEITSELNGFYKDLDVDKGKHLKFIKGFDNEFYRLLKKELKRNLRFDNPVKLGDNKIEFDSMKDLSTTPTETHTSEDDVIIMEESYLNYIESLAKLDSNQFRRNRVLNLIKKIRKQNFYTKRSSYIFFEKYKKGLIK